MKSAAHFAGGSLVLFLVLGSLLQPARAITVYDNDLDFSDTNNPSGTWSYLQGNTLLTHFTPVPLPSLAVASTNGYWGTSSSSLSSAILRTTANGSSTGLWSDSDFLAGDMLVRTPDPQTGGPTVLAWTAPSAGTLTYSGLVWYADAASGPWSNDFTLALNAGPALEAGTAGIGFDRNNFANLVNGMLPIGVNAGDVLALELTPSVGMPTGSLAGVIWTIDFQPIPEPSSVVLLALGSLGMIAWRRRITEARRTSR